MTRNRVHSFGRIRIGRISLALAISVVMLGCGAVRAPIPPEEIGIEAKLLKEKQPSKTENDSTPQEFTPIEEDTITLPPLRPRGRR